MIAITLLGALITMSVGLLGWLLISSIRNREYDITCYAVMGFLGIGFVIALGAGV